jgi:hypothetical protein
MSLRRERLEPELLTECADWIAEQMAEEGYLIDAGLIELIIERELASPARIPAVSHAEMAAQLLDILAADGVQGVPEAIDARLVRLVLEWEDEFLALAGRPR